jgi:hypothetical protein
VERELITADDKVEISELQQIEAVHRVFPFSSIKKVSQLKCTGWAKHLLYQSMTIENVEKVIKHFNH